MLICFIGTRGVPATYSGFETCVEQLGWRMAARGHRVIVHCRATHYRDPVAMHRGMELTYLPAIRGKHLETLSHTALSAFKLPADGAIVCMGVGNAPIVRALEMRGRRTVFNVDGADWLRDKWGRFATSYLRWCERLASSSSSILVADAASVQHYYRDQYSRASELVAYGADPPADCGTTTLQALGVLPDKYALFVGRLVPDNAAHDFLDGIRLANWDGPVMIVGHAPYSQDYIRHLHEMAPPNAIFTGYQFGSAYQQLTHHARVFVLAAAVGGTHPVLVEQMAAGNCILARDTESNREVLGGTGLLWRTPAELAQLLTLTNAEPGLRRRLGDQASKRARQHYDWEAVTTKYLDLCERTLVGR